MTLGRGEATLVFMRAKVKVRELKNRLSSLLRQVEGIVAVPAQPRRKVIERLFPPSNQGVESRHVPLGRAKD